MNKFAILFLASLTLSFANDNESTNIIKGSAYGNQVVEEKAIDYFIKNEQSTYRKEAIYNWYLQKASMNKPEYETQEAKLIKLVDENSTIGKLANLSVDTNTSVNGYCLIKEDIFVGKQPSAGYFECETNIGSITMFGNMRPLNQYAALLFDPVYIEFKDWRYPVTSSRVTNEAKTSYNIATYVNDRKLSEIALTTTSSAADELKTASNDYLKALEQSRTKQETEYVTVGTGSSQETVAVQNTNTEPPRIIDYFGVAAVNIVAGAIKAGAEVFKKDLPYLYDIVGGSKIWIDLQVDYKGEKIR
ncbi:hypothetical protein JJB27_09025 [Campylobacter fetus subsp. venerealis]|uniref:hypothetical protein n=1 Tax=Campylobacter fetus TaxID=196 RepID=UPI00190C6734|nr:hypothetical protein [Campylobacter fetus]MBK3499206.1 hypothetical protein [Campylobacter fetus subsp. venerealis]MBK3503165.1 hypothetical protein [Campylobacter fetus subsp. venerealis]